MQKHKELPFLIESSAISKWLGTLALNKPVQSAFEIYNVLVILVKTPDKYQQHFAALLPKLTPTTLQLSLYLERLSGTSDNNLDIKKRKTARLSINLLRYLAILYYKLGITDDKQLNVCLVNSLQLSHLCLKQSALIYERPSSAIWKMIGRIYQLASEKNIMDVPVQDPLSILKNQDCIADTLKTLLLFKLCKPYCLKHADILRLSYLIEQHYELLVLADKESRFSLHIWDYNLPQAVKIITPNTEKHSSFVFLDSHLLLSILKNENFCSIVNIISCNQSLVPVLTLTKTPSLTKKISTSLASAIKIIELYNLTEKLNESTSNNQDIPLFSEEGKAEKIVSEDLSQRVTSPLLIQDATVKESSDLSFVLIELESFSGNSEELITVFDGEKKPQIGIVRKITQLKNNNYYQLLVEILSSDVKIVNLAFQTDKTKALLFTISKQKACLLAPSHKYSTGSTVQIEEQPFYLTKLLEYTENFMRYRVQEYRLTD